MAWPTQVANLCEPVTISSLEFLSPIVENLAITPYEITFVDTTPAPIQNRFPVPGAAAGFLMDLYALGVELPIRDWVTSPHMISGVLIPVESSRLEPTVGQIWPR